MRALQLDAATLAPGRPYAERDDREPAWHDRMAQALWHGAARPLVDALSPRLRSARRFCARVDALGAGLGSLPDAQLRERFKGQAGVLRRQGFRPEPAASCFALVREASGRVLGQRPYDSQVIAGWWLLGGHLAEMATGEGKTLAATLPACTAAIAGLPVHVITVNDYLAERDAAAMTPLYAFLGLECGSVAHGMSRMERRQAYSRHVCYASNKELAFDYLRDRAALGDRASALHLALEGLRGWPADDDPVVLRGLCFALIDEADSVLIDEARTPLILSRTLGATPRDRSIGEWLRLAVALELDEHFRLDFSRRRVRLTASGRAEIERATAGPEPWASGREIEENVERALAALWLYLPDEHYVVVDDKVQIVDAATGRSMPDRAWEQGLHQMIESKEGVTVTGQRETLARITYQRLFRRYLRIGGMTGTGAEVAAEIGCTYGLSVATVPLHQASRRHLLGAQCLPDAAAKWHAVALVAEDVALRQERPVLIGTRTVRASEELSAVLREHGLAHVVLNARQDRDEAGLVAAAGQAGRITVATNMAGRGTDILLGEGVAARGGLHVILTEYNESRRIDRQLIGRCARQGDPGSAQAIVSLDDELFVAHAPNLRAWLAAWSAAHGTIPTWGVAALRRRAQGRAEWLNREVRESLLKQDRQLARLLSFSGRGE